MKHLIFRKTALVIVLAILTTIGTPVLALEPRATYYIESQGGNITRGTDSVFQIYYSVVANRVMDQIGVYYVQIQRSIDQETWTTERTMHYTSYPEWVDNDTVGHAGSISYAGTRGYYYRARIGFMAKIDGDSEFTYMYTNTIYIPHSGNGGRIGS